MVVDLPETLAGNGDSATASVLFLALAPDGLTAGIGEVSAPSASRTAPEESREGRRPPILRPRPSAGSRVFEGR
jgi:hypothetical protein